MVTKNQKTIIVGLTVAIIFVLIGVFFLSYALETLDLKAEQLGAQEQPIYDPPLPDYVIPGMDNPWATVILGIASTLLLFAVGLIVAKLLNKKKS
ncbi:MAG: cobalamin biosynthesis protein CbiN [Candidatus Bathyarchaeota archaeon]|nr:cobalamin biosynthesis protein CbiN [Candidatus Bathyarchaeota archaeon]